MVVDGLLGVGAQEEESDWLIIVLPEEEYDFDYRPFPFIKGGRAFSLVANNMRYAMTTKYVIWKIEEGRETQVKKCQTVKEVWEFIFCLSREEDINSYSVTMYKEVSLVEFMEQ